MTESELMEVAQVVWANAISLGALFITILSGYLIVAYVVGAAMSPNQLRIVNVLYVGLNVFLIGSFLGFAVNASELESLAFDMTTQREVVPLPYFSYGISGLFLFCHFASLKFMADIRRDGNE